jgi:hypothetical protein
MVVVLSCVAAASAACGRSREAALRVPSPAAVQAAIRAAPIDSPYKARTVQRVVPLDGDRFAVLFAPPYYVGVGTQVPLPLHGAVTRNDCIVYLLERNSDGSTRPGGRPVSVPFPSAAPAGISGTR